MVKTIPTETSFFRDSDFFNALKSSIFPELMRLRRLDRQLNIWSAACSSGQEPYSLALVLHARFPLLTNWELQLTASDRSWEMLAKADRGSYSQAEVTRRLPPELLKRYFYRQGDRWQIDESIRSMVQFRYLNLLDPWPTLPPMDLVVMRNVLIYFDKPTRRQILTRVRQVLKPDGYLFLGSTETPFGVDSAFELVRFDRAIGYRLRSEES
ncbi:MAG: protein-glutamate O-methyltransferase CheR [Cyanobacteriota bacterium]|nr:protein-glutamate O-methyltransferase CheR [Cyanobacteriota bacterium]